MSFLGKFRIITKIFSVIALIGGMVLAGIWYATARMSAIDDAYSAFLEKDAKSVTTVSRLNRSIFEIRYLVYRTLAEPEHHRGAARFGRNRRGLLAGAVGGAVAVPRQQSIEARGR